MFKLSYATKSIVVGGLLICAVVLGSAFPRDAEANVLLGSARSFAVLGGSTVTNTGPSVVTGDLGVSPGAAVTGFPPGIVNGTIHAADAVALRAQSDVVIAYNSLAGRACDFNLTGQDLGGMTLIPGVYCFSSSAQLTGMLTLDAQGDSGALFIFQIGSTLTTASGSSVQMIGGSPCNVLWQVGSSATIGTTTTFVGNILALTSISLNTGASVNGRALARNGAVTMDTNTISNAACITVDVPTSTPDTPTETPETPTGTPDVPTTTPDGPTTTPDGPGTVGPGTSTPVVTTPGTETPGETPPATGTPGTDAPGETPLTTGTPGTGTSTPIIPGTETTSPGTPTSTIQQEETPATTPGTGTAGTATPGTSTPATGTPTTATPHATTPVTNTPTATATKVPAVSFPNTGSGGMSAEQNQQSLAFTSLATAIALVLLLTGGLAFMVERRSRR